MATGLPPGKGRLAAAYLQATAASASLLALDSRTAGKNRLASLNARPSPGIFERQNQDEMQPRKLFKDVTNLDQPTHPYSRHPRAEHGACQLPKCRKNIELLEKSMEMIEHLKDYVARATAKPADRVEKIPASIQTDQRSPERPELLRTLELLWTTKSKPLREDLALSPNRRSMARPIGTQTAFGEQDGNSEPRRSPRVNQSSQTSQKFESLESALAELRADLERSERSRLEAEAALKRQEREVASA